jgi:O-acetyl-ADP-ribose deacetylase (regulator of RNase III)
LRGLFIHAVGPIWHGGGRGESRQLVSCYRRSLGIAGSHHVASIALPAISTGIYDYPIELATRVAVASVVDAGEYESSLREVIFCCFSAGDLAVYERLLTPDNQCLALHARLGLCIGLVPAIR